MSSPSRLFLRAFSIASALALAGPAPSASVARGDYCVAAPNSTGVGAVISSSGSTSIAAADFTLAVGGAPPLSFGMFFYGGGQLQTPFGNGFRCVRGAGRGVHRFKGILRIDVSGATQRAVDLTRPPAGSGRGQLTPGATWYFQFLYRDPLGPLPFGFNASDGLTVTFTP